MNNDIIQKNNDDISHHLLQWPSLDRKCPVPAHQKLTNTLAAPQQGIFQIEAIGRQAKSTLSLLTVSSICLYLFHWMVMSVLPLL